MKKEPPERSEGVLLSIARRDNGIFTPSTPNLFNTHIKQRSTPIPLVYLKCRKWNV